MPNGIVGLISFGLVWFGCFCVAIFRWLAAIPHCHTVIALCTVHTVYVHISKIQNHTRRAIQRKTNCCESLVDEMLLNVCYAPCTPPNANFGDNESTF